MTTDPLQDRRISIKSWCFGILSWLLLVAGSPGIPLSNCAGIGMFLGAALLALIAYIRVLVDTRGGRVGWRALGWILLPIGVIAVCASALEPTSMFGDAVKNAAISRFHQTDPDVPDVVMLRSTYWQLHPPLRHVPWWIGSCLLMTGGIRLVGERRAGWLATVAVLSAATGPLVLRICLWLIAAGYRGSE